MALITCGSSATTSCTPWASSDCRQETNCGYFVAAALSWLPVRRLACNACLVESSPCMQASGCRGQLRGPLQLALPPFHPSHPQDPGRFASCVNAALDAIERAAAARRRGGAVHTAGAPPARCVLAAAGLSCCVLTGSVLRLPAVLGLASSRCDILLVPSILRHLRRRCTQPCFLLPVPPGQGRRKPGERRRTAGLPAHCCRVSGTAARCWSGTAAATAAPAPAAAAGS